MTRRSRSQALVIWQQIANGLLHEPGGKAPGKLSDRDIPSQEYFEAIDFLRQVASEILLADESSSQKRSKSLLKALQLEGKRNPDETALRKTLEILDDFAGPGDKVSVETKANLARTLIMSTTESEDRKQAVEERSDIEQNRQLNELKKRIRQHNK
jgi:hypothetical protein